MAYFVGFLIAYLTTALHDIRLCGSLRNELQDFSFVVAIGSQEDNIISDDIFCLGSVVSKSSVITCASCFNDYDYSDYEVIHGAFKSGRRLRVRNSKRRKGQVKMRKSGENATSERRSNSMDPNNKEDVNQANPEDDGYLVPQSLYRIDPVSKHFVKLTAEGQWYAAHASYQEIHNTEMSRHNSSFKLWKNDIAILRSTGSFDLEKVLSIALHVENFNDYIKSLHEGMMNTLNCRVIGLIEYADGGSYTPVDTEVVLVAHRVLVLYETCNHPSCSEDLCEETGYFIHRDYKTPMPLFVRGSPVVCGGKVLSAVNIHSRCDDRRYSAGFATPQAVRFLVKSLHLEERTRALRAGRNVTLTAIPRPKWVTRATGTAIFLNRWHVAYSLLVLIHKYPLGSEH